MALIPANPFQEAFSSTLDQVGTLRSEEILGRNAFVVHLGPSPLRYLITYIDFFGSLFCSDMARDIQIGKTRIEKMAQFLKDPDQAQQLLPLLQNQLTEHVEGHIRSAPNESEAIYQGLELAQKAFKNHPEVFQAVYNQCLLNWKWKSQANSIGCYIKSHCTHPITDGMRSAELATHGMLTPLERGTLTQEDLDYLGLYWPEATPERSRLFDCFRWALLSYQAPDLRDGIRNRYCVQGEDPSSETVYATKNVISFVEKKGFHLLTSKELPKPKDLVMYFSEIPPLLCSEATHFGVLSDEGYVLSKLGGCSGEKIFKHKIWQIGSRDASKTLFFRYNGT
jgi:hypothetical protein